MMMLMAKMQMAKNFKNPGVAGIGGMPFAGQQEAAQAAMSAIN